MPMRRSRWAWKNRATACATTLGASPQMWPSRRYRSSQKWRAAAVLGWGLPLPVMAGGTSSQQYGYWSRRSEPWAVHGARELAEGGRRKADGRLLEQDFLRGAHALP